MVGREWTRKSIEDIAKSVLGDNGDANAAIGMWVNITRRTNSTYPYSQPTNYPLVKDNNIYTETLYDQSSKSYCDSIPTFFIQNYGGTLNFLMDFSYFFNHNPHNYDGTTVGVNDELEVMLGFIPTEFWVSYDDIFNTPNYNYQNLPEYFNDGFTRQRKQYGCIMKEINITYTNLTCEVYIADDITLHQTVNLERTDNDPESYNGGAIKPVPGISDVLVNSLGAQLSMSNALSGSVSSYINKVGLPFTPIYFKGYIDKAVTVANNLKSGAGDDGNFILWYYNKSTN